MSIVYKKCKMIEPHMTRLMVCATMRNVSECNVTHKKQNDQKDFGFLIIERKEVGCGAQRCATYPSVM